MSEDEVMMIFIFNCSLTSTPRRGSSWALRWESNAGRWWSWSESMRTTRSFSTSARRRWRRCPSGNSNQRCQTWKKSSSRLFLLTVPRFCNFCLKSSERLRCSDGIFCFRNKEENKDLEQFFKEILAYQERSLHYLICILLLLRSWAGLTSPWTRS